MMTDAFIEAFLAIFDDSRFPEEFLKQYELMECLSHNDLGETLLVKDRQTGEHYVAKCYADLSLLSRTNESELLKRLHHAGLPTYISEYHNENMLCVVRSFVHGTSLDQLVQEKPLTTQQSIDLAAQLCEILVYLHGQTPPIIHRDIKPQNIIVDDTGKVTIIDFGTSRTYNEGSKEDTLFFGTRHYAAPEQYGFSQTDCRSDIFSLGVLLCWLLTGSVEVGQAQKTIPNRRLARIVAKCTAFNPKDRYKNAVQVRDALTGRVTRRGILGALCTALIVLAAAFTLPNFLKPHNQPPVNLTFKEHLIEHAVRLTLGKDNSAPISEQDLLSITELYVFGNKAAADQSTFSTYGQSFINNDGTVFRGDIDTLEDLVKLKNLRRVNLVYQQIQDLTPLSELSYLESLDLRHNRIEDVSPLADLSSLNSLFIFDNLVSDLTALSSCPRLSSLDIGYNLVKSTAALDGLDALEILHARKSPLQSLDHIESHPMLVEVYLSETHLLDLSPLLALPRLKKVEVDETMRAAAEAIEDQTQFEITYQ